MWLLFLVLGGILLATQSLISRKHMQSQKEVWTTVFVLGLIGEVIALPFLLINLESWPIVKPVIWLMVISTIVGMLQYYCNYASYRYLSPSVATTIGKIQYVLIIIGGVIFFSESFGIYQIIGSALIIGAGLFLINYNKMHIDPKGLLWRMGSVFFFAVISLLSKLLVTELKPLVLFGFGALIGLIQFPIIALLTPNFGKKLKKTVSNSKTMKYLILIGVLVSAAGLLILYGLAQAPVSIAYLVVEAGVLWVVVGEYFFLSKDRKYFWSKLTAAVLALIGLVLLRTF